MNLMRRNPLALSTYRPRPFDEQLGRMEIGVLKVTLPRKQGSAATRIAIQ